MGVYNMEYEMSKAEQIKQVELRLGRERQRRNIAVLSDKDWKVLSKDAELHKAITGAELI